MKTVELTVDSKPVVPALEQRQPKAPHRHPAWMPGDVSHQGDLILVALTVLPKSAVLRHNRQLAEGATKGSRHVLIGGTVYDADKVEARKMLKADAKLDVDERYIGPVFSGAAIVTHPEHAHQVFPEQVCTVVVYQRNLDAEEREQRARD